MSEILTINQNRKPIYDIVFTDSFDELSQKMEELGYKGRKAAIVTDTNVEPLYAEAVKKEIVELSDILGLIVEVKQELGDADIEKLIAERQQARKDKNFARADEIRNELLEKGIILEDTREGVKWKKA